MKKTNMFYKALAVLITCLIIVSTFPLSMATSNEITSWTSEEIVNGKTIVRITEDTVVKADIPENVIVIVESGVLTVPVGGEIEVMGTVWLQSGESYVLTETDSTGNSGRILIKKGETGSGGAFVKGSYPIFAYQGIELEQEEGFGSETLEPIVLLGEKSTVALQTNANMGSVITVGNELGEESEITLNSYFAMGPDDELYIEDFVSISDNSVGEILAEKGAKIYNLCNEESMIEAVNAVENAEVYHSVSWSKTENGEELSSQSAYMKKDELLTVEAETGKVFKKITDNITGVETELDSVKYEVAVTAPVDVTLEETDIEYTVTFTDVENGVVGFASTNDGEEEILLSETSVVYGKDVTFVIKADEGYKCVGFEVSGDKYSSVQTQSDDLYGQTGATISGITSDLVITAEFVEVYAATVTVRTESQSGAFYPESKHAFSAEVLPVNTKVKDIAWSLETLDGEEVDEKIAEISENGILKVGSEATASSSFKVVATSLSKADEEAEEIRGEYVVNVSVVTDENIDDYFEFTYNNEESSVSYSPDKWSNTDILVAIKNLETSDGESYTFSLTQDGTAPTFDSSVNDKIAVEEGTDKLRLRVYKLDAEKNVIGVIDFVGLTLKIDKSSPVVEYTETHDESKWFSSFTVNFTVNENESGIQKVYYTRTNDSNAESTEIFADESGKYSFTINSDTTENTEFYLWAKDIAGNVSEIKSFNVKVDTTAASAKIKVHSEVIASTLNIITFGLVKVNSSTEIQFVLSDKAANDLDGSGIKTVKYRFIREDENADSVAWEEIDCQEAGNICLTEVTKSVSVPREDGLYAIELVVIDAVGNEQSLTFELITEESNESGLEINNSEVKWNISIDETEVEEHSINYMSDDEFVMSAVSVDDKDERIESDMLSDVSVNVSYNDGAEYDLGTSYDTSEGFVIDKATFLTADKNGLLNDFAGLETNEDGTTLKNGSYIFRFTAVNVYGTLDETFVEVIIDNTVPGITANYYDDSVNYEVEKVLIIKPDVGCSGLKSVELVGEDGEKTAIEADENNEYLFTATEAKQYEFVVTSNNGLEASTVFNASLVNTEEPVIGVVAEHIDAQQTTDYEGEWINSGYIRYTITNSNEECLGEETYLYSEDGESWETIVEDCEESSAVFEVKEDCEKTYIFKVVAENGKESESEEYTFKRDTFAPVIEDIVYGNSVGASVLKNIFYFGANATVKVYVSDELSGVGTVELQYIQADETVTLTEFATEEGDKMVATFEINYTEFESKAFEGTLKATLTDVAGNKTEETKSDDVVIIDGTKPAIAVTDALTSSIPSGYYNAKEEVIIKISERNFNSDETFVKVNATDDDGLSLASLNADNLDLVENNIYKVTEWTHNGDIHEAKVVFNEDADYSVTVETTDLSGNVADSVSAEFTIDKTMPEVTVSFLGEIKRTDEETGTKYFSVQPTMEIKVVEHNFNWTDETDLVVVATDINGDTLELPVLSGWNQSGNTYTATILLTDGIYTIDVQTTDKAGNNTKAANEIVSVDTTTPEAIELSYTKQVVRSLIANLTFGVYHKDVAELVISMEDVTTGIKTVSAEFISEGEETGVSQIVSFDEHKDVKQGNSSYTATFTYEGTFRGNVKFNITDYADNIKTVTNSDLAAEIQPGGELEGEKINEVIIIDDKVPQIMDLAQSSDIVNYAHYSEDKTVTIKIMEGNFFAEDVTISVVGIDEGGNKIDNISAELQKVESVDENESEDIYSVINGWTTETDDLGNIYNVAKFIVSKEADYTVSVQYTDRSGNTADPMLLAFTIDKTAPVIDITYDKTPVLDSELTTKKYFGDTVVATVRVVEHNFNWKAETDYSVTATDIIGTVLSLPTLGEWTAVEGASDTYEAKVDLPVNGIYTINVQTTDKAGNNTVFDTQKVVTDIVGAEDLTLSYTNSVGRSLINNLTFGVFFKDTAQVFVEMKDAIAGVKKITLKGILDSGVSSINSSFEKTVNFDEVTDAKEGNDAYTATFSIPAQFRGTLLVEVTDYSGNFVSATNTDLSSETEEKASEIVVVDNVSPVISDLAKTSDITAGEFYNTDQTVKIVVNEANFFEDEVKIKIVSADDTGKTVTTLDSSLTAVSDAADTYTASQWQTTGEDTHTKSLVFSADGDYTVTVSYTDRSGNVAEEKSINFTIDKTAPVINITYDKEPVFVNETTKNKYHNGVTTATIEITEHNFNWKNDDINITAKDINGNTIDIPTIGSWSESIANVHTAQVVFSNDAIYTFDVQTTDKASNNTIHETEYLVVDATAPEIVGIVFSENSDTVDSFESTSYTSYKYFSNGDTTVTITARDNTSGVQKIEFYGIDYTSDESGVRKEFSPSQKTYEEGNGEVVYTFTLPANFKGNIYVQATDYSTNASNSGSDSGYTKSVGVVVEDETKHEETLTMSIVANVEANENGFYNADLPVTLKVDDTYSGINNLKYKVGSANEVGVDFTANEDVTYSWTQDVTVNAQQNNNNKVEVVVSYVDNAGNPHEARQTFQVDYKIDVTAPVISVSYNNNKVINSSFFNENRVATVTIEELNFDAEDVVFKITKDGKEYTSITPAAGSWKHNDNTHTVKIAYSSDGDYTFDVSYTDLAGNKNEKVNYGKSVVPTKFTIDKTAPVIEDVTYDNNNASNFNYYSSSRTATITIREHNFVAEKAVVKITATDDGVSVSAPSSSAWHKVGTDLYAATVVFSNDALYKVGVTCIDNANNKAADFAEDEFYIDNIDPEVTITGIAPQSANNGKVAPVIKVTDTNIDYGSIEVKLIGSKQGVVEPLGIIGNPHNGYTFTFDDLEKIKENDDIYTLSVVATDLSGRTNKFVTAFDANGNPVNLGNNSIMFSVNRFGSTYSFSDEVEELNGKVVIEAEDLVIQEINPDKLDHHKIIIYKSGSQAIELVEGEDYTVSVSGGNGTWYTYTYRIFKENFADEGYYSVDITSTDAAGNEAQNTTDTKNMALEFGVDATKPKINITNVKEDDIFEVESYDVCVNVTDLSLKNVSIFLDGKQIEAESNLYEYVFTVEGSTSMSEASHSLKVVAVDKAGNTEEVTIQKFTVTTSRIVALLSNRVFVMVALGILLLLLILAIVLILLKRRKDYNSQEQF